MQIKPIAVTEANFDRIDATIKEVEGPRITARTLDHRDLTDAIAQAEKQLKPLPKRLWVGATVVCDPHVVPNSYMGRAEGTVAVLVRRSKDWALVEVQRRDTRSKSYGESFPARVTLAGDINREDLLEAMLRNLRLDLPAAPQGPEGA